jgi:hypothetical protein
MLIDERACGPVLVDDLGVEVRPGEAVVFEGRVYFVERTIAHLVALIGDPCPLPNGAPRSAERPPVELLALPEMLSRAEASNNDCRPPSSFPEFDEAMENILHDIYGMAGFAPHVIQEEGLASGLASGLVRSIETRAFHAIRLLRDYAEGLSQRPPPSSPKRRKPAPLPRAA